MKYTGNYNLKKPDGTDVVNIEDFNENADIIDAELKKLNDVIEDLNAENITLPDGKTIAEKFDEIETEIGNIEELDTDTKSNIIAAINEIYQEIVAHKADYEQHTSYAIATGTNSYAVNIDGVTSLVEGMSIKVKFQNANTGTATLNINGLGAKEIRKSNGNSLSAGNIKAGQILHLVYTGSVFQLLGEGGEYGNVTPGDVIKGVTFGTEEGLKTGTLELTGNAAAADVLSGKTFYNTNPKSKLTGSMPNRGAVTHTITTQGGSYTIPAGYHNGSGKVTASFANLVAENIKLGVNIGGVVGTLIPASTLIPGTDYTNHSVCQTSFSASSASDYVHIGKLAINLPGTYYVRIYFSHGTNNYGGSVLIKKGSTTLVEFSKSSSASYGEHYLSITTSYGDIWDVSYKGGRSTNVHITLMLHPDTFATKL